MDRSFFCVYLSAYTYLVFIVSLIVGIESLKPNFSSNYSQLVCFKQKYLENKIIEIYSIISFQYYILLCTYGCKFQDPFGKMAAEKQPKWHIDEFHLHLLVFLFVYQFNSRIRVLVHSSFPND